VNAIDTDGRLIIFVNGMHYGDGGSSKYWSNIDRTIAKKLNDNKAMYIDGSFGGAFNTTLTGVLTNNYFADNRINLGYHLGLSNAKEIYNNLSENETIKIITHSMGSATGKGIVKALLKYAQSIDKDSKIVLELDLAPFQPEEQSGNPQINTYTISHWHDKIAGPSFMKNAKNYRTHKDVSEKQIFKEHNISSFEDDLNKLIDEGQIEFNNFCN